MFIRLLNAIITLCLFSIANIKDLCHFSKIYAYTNCRFSNLVTVSKCMLYMPTEEELQNKIERQKNFYRLQHTEKSIE